MPSRLLASLCSLFSKINVIPDFSSPDQGEKDVFDTTTPPTSDVASPARPTQRPGNIWGTYGLHQRQPWPTPTQFGLSRRPALPPNPTSQDQRAGVPQALYRQQQRTALLQNYQPQPYRQPGDLGMWAKFTGDLNEDDKISASSQSKISPWKR